MGRRVRAIGCAWYRVRQASLAQPGGSASGPKGGTPAVAVGALAMVARAYQEIGSDGLTSAGKRVGGRAIAH